MSPGIWYFGYLIERRQNKFHMVIQRFAGKDKCDLASGISKTTLIKTVQLVKYRSHRGTKVSERCLVYIKNGVGLWRWLQYNYNIMSVAWYGLSV